MTPAQEQARKALEPEVRAVLAKARALRDGGVLLADRGLVEDRMKEICAMLGGLLPPLHLKAGVDRDGVIRKVIVANEP